MIGFTVIDSILWTHRFPRFIAIGWDGTDWDGLGRNGWVDWMLKTVREAELLLLRGEASSRLPLRCLRAESGRKSELRRPVESSSPMQTLMSSLAFSEHLRLLLRCVCCCGGGGGCCDCGGCCGGGGGGCCGGGWGHSAADASGGDCLPLSDGSPRLGQSRLSGSDVSEDPDSWRLRRPLFRDAGYKSHSNDSNCQFQIQLVDEWMEWMEWMDR